MDDTTQNPTQGAMPQAPVMPSQPADSAAPAPVAMPAQDMPAAPAQDGAQSTPAQLGPVTNEELMEELQHIEDRLDEMEEKL